MLISMLLPIIFRLRGNSPEEIFFSKPQYNTWIELMYNQNQVDIERYAQDILANNLSKVSL